MTNSSNAGGGAQGAATKDENINVMVFENAEFGPVRTLVDTNGDPLFCGKNVCDALEYAKTDKAVREHVNNLEVLKRYLKVPGSLRKDGTRTMLTDDALRQRERILLPGLRFEAGSGAAFQALGHLRGTSFHPQKRIQLHDSDEKLKFRRDGIDIETNR